MVWNRTAERILGHTARDVLGRACCELFPGRHDNGNCLCYKGCHVMSPVKLADPIQNFDMETRTKSGLPVRLNVSTIVTADGGSGPFTVHLFRNITDTTGVNGRGAGPADAAGTNGDLSRRELESRA